MITETRQYDYQYIALGLRRISWPCSGWSLKFRIVAMGFGNYEWLALGGWAALGMMLCSLGGPTRQRSTLIE